MQASPADWLFFPDYRASNPYQALLAEALAPRRVAAASIGAALDEAAAGCPDLVFHLHWEDATYRDANNASEAAALAGAFLAECAAFRELGGRLVWTVHNAGPHENRFPDVDAALRRELAEMADLVHVHGATAAKLLRGEGVPAERLLVHPHPAFLGAYPDDISDQAARRYFHLPDSATVFAFFGTMRGYKGLDLLQSAFARLHADRPDTALILAGRHPIETSQRYVTIAPGVRLVPRFIEDATVQYVFRAADFAVLPYRRILTSGAVMLALGFARPVIAPALPSLLEILHPGEDALCHAPDDAQALADTMATACDLSATQRAGMRAAAAQTAGCHRFSALGAALQAALG